MYKSKKYSDCGIYLCFVYLLGYKIIIVEYYLVIKSELLVEYNKTFSFLKLSALLSVLVRVY